MSATSESGSTGAIVAPLSAVRFTRLLDRFDSATMGAPPARQPCNGAAAGTLAQGGAMAIVEPRSTPGGSASGLHGLRPHWGLLLALGILELLLGLIGLSLSWLVTLVSVLFFAWLLVLSGAMHLVRAFRTRGWEGVALHLLIGILQAAVGVLLVLRPAAGAVSDPAAGRAVPGLGTLPHRLRAGGAHRWLGLAGAR